MGTQTKTLAEQVADGIMNLIQETPYKACLLYTSPSPRDISGSRMPSSA